MNSSLHHISMGSNRRRTWWYAGVSEGINHPQTNLKKTEGLHVNESEKPSTEINPSYHSHIKERA